MKIGGVFFVFRLFFGDVKFGDVVCVGGFSCLENYIDTGEFFLMNS